MNMGVGALPTRSLVQKLNAEDHEHIGRSLKSVGGMWDQRHKRIGDLSGGQNSCIIV